MKEDAQLLEQFKRDRSEAAFGELVTRHIDLVYSAALRVVNGDSHLAQDVTQTVFADLARKAGALPGGLVLAGWLYRHSCYTAAKAVRGERRRRTREQASMEMKTLEDNSEPAWAQLAPHLDDGLNQLAAADRDAIVLRFFQRRDLRAVGAALGVNEDAAQKRVSRALEKLREILNRRGVVLSATALGAVIMAGAVSAAPAGLAAAVTASSLTAAAGVGTGIGLGALKIMSMSKLQVGVAGVILAAGLATPLVLQHQSLGRLRAENQRLVAENRDLAEQAQRVEALTAENARLSRLAARPGQLPTEVNSQLSELLKLRGQVTRLQADTRTDVKPASPMAEMMKSPEMKDLMKSTFAVTIDKSFARLFTDLQLTPEQAAALKELLLKKEMVAMDHGMDMFSGETNRAKLAEIARQMTDQRAAVDAEIRQYLGEDGFAKYQAYEKTKVDRDTVSQFQDKLAGGAALNANQEQQLIQAMSEERGNFKFTTAVSDQSKFNADMSSYFNEDTVKRAQQDMERLNQQYLSRAQTILLPDQLDAFQKFLADQQKMQGSMMQIIPKMFGPKTNGK